MQQIDFWIIHFFISNIKFVFENIRLMTFLFVILRNGRVLRGNIGHFEVPSTARTYDNIQKAKKWDVVWFKDTSNVLGHRRKQVEYINLYCIIKMAG